MSAETKGLREVVEILSDVTLKPLFKQEEVRVIFGDSGDFHFMLTNGSCKFIYKNAELKQKYF